MAQVIGNKENRKEATEGLELSFELAKQVFSGSGAVLSPATVRICGCQQF
jgi:hypothetical protein